MLCRAIIILWESLAVFSYVDPNNRCASYSEARLGVISNVFNYHQI